MKRVLFFMVLSFFSLSAFAGSPPRMYSEVLKSKAFFVEVGKRSTLESISCVETQRCHGCYKFEVKYSLEEENDAKEKVWKQHTAYFLTKYKSLNSADVEVIKVEIPK
jgi:hypothetical protein